MSGGGVIDKAEQAERLRALISAWYEETEDADSDDGLSLGHFLARYGVTVPDGVVGPPADMPDIDFSRLLIQ